MTEPDRRYERSAPHFDHAAIADFDAAVLPVILQALEELVAAGRAVKLATGPDAGRVVYMVRLTANLLSGEQHRTAVHPITGEVLLDPKAELRAEMRRAARGAAR